MWFRTLFAALLAGSSRMRSRQAAPAPSCRRRSRSFRPRLQILEDRTLLSTYVVDSLTDTGAGSGLTGDLRYCITQADQSANAGSTITFDTATIGSTITLSHGQLVISDTMTITGPGASSLTISGNNSSRLFDETSVGSLTLEKLTLSGGLAKGTGIAAEGGAIYSSGTLALSGVTVESNEALGSNGAAGQPGAAGGNGANAYGGGIYVAGGTVTLTNDILSSNNAAGGDGGEGATSSGVVLGPGGNGGAGSGGALYVAAGSVTLTNDTLSGNNAVGGNGGAGGRNGSSTSSGVRYGPYGSGGSGSGGGLYLAGGGVTLNNDTLTSNQAVGGNGGPGGLDGTGLSPRGGTGGSGGAGLGGGLYAAAGTVALTNATFSSNNAVGGNGGTGGPGPVDGYGVGHPGGSGGNGGAGLGGSLYAGAEVVTLDDTTLSSNNAVGGNGGAGGSGSPPGGNGNDGAVFGGGLDVVFGSNVLLYDTLVAANLAGGKPSDIQGSLSTASNYNLIGDGSGGISTANHNLLGSSASPLNPQLGPLGNYGGPTQTMALLAGSPAINAGDNTNAPTYDQRGPGFARIVGATIDIGAFEVQAANSLTLSPSTLPTATVGDTYGPVTITATGGSGSYTFALASGSKVPPGLTLSSTGVLSGKPTTTSGSPFSFTITATDTSNPALTGSQAYTLTVDSAITISPASLPVATVADAVNDQLTAEGGSGTGYSFALASGSSLPAGLALSSSGAITGTPTQSGTYSFTIVATDSIGATGNHAYSLTVDPAVVVQPPAIIPIATVGDPYPSNVQFAASGGSGTGYTFKATGLPSGMTLTKTGLLSGTPTKAGTYTITATATDSKKGTGSVTVQLTVDPKIVLTPSTSPVATIGDSYSQKLSATGGSGSGYTFALASGSSLPPGLSLGGGILSGNVTVAGSYTFTIVATDSIGATGSRTYTLTVDPALTISPSTLPAATIGQKYTEILLASGGSGTGYSFKASGLPTWLTLSASGTLSGTSPSGAPSQITFMVTVTDSKKGTDTLQYTLTIDAS